MTTSQTDWVATLGVPFGLLVLGYGYLFSDVLLAIIALTLLAICRILYRIEAALDGDDGGDDSDGVLEG
ncbi:hypothetical protein [Natronolimnohabitans innermongolicus]|uniref:Uncharacterized protein n=1 Tax=Natronolimnohabitans innermongolicus JCM 12255 TaxID=1227499 RepID=L9XHL7_9EURY|nr:hypothetical protein [Natronolimnohabitans innermongolicus]ELY61210.1 hypothetical protein C493_02813 [Natronolimnohabitans innermongolicus JCM 12255]